MLKTRACRSQTKNSCCKLFSHIQQRLIQIRNNILHILNPHTQPHQTIRNPYVVPHFPASKHASSEQQQINDSTPPKLSSASAQIFTWFKTAAPLPRPQIKQSSPRTLLLPPTTHAADAQPVRDKHLSHLRMRIQMPRHRQTIRIVLQHPHRQSLQPRDTRKQSIGARPAPADFCVK
jgi:hypothetical protein